MTRIFLCTTIRSSYNRSLNLYDEDQYDAYKAGQLWMCYSILENKAIFGYEMNHDHEVVTNSMFNGEFHLITTILDFKMKLILDMTFSQNSRN